MSSGELVATVVTHRRPEETSPAVYDLIEVARRITFRGHVQRMLAGLVVLRGTLLDLAEQHRETVMPGYTHGQHAQPTTFAHWLTMFEEVFALDTARLLSFHERLNRSDRPSALGGQAAASSAAVAVAAAFLARYTVAAGVVVVLTRPG